MDPREAALTILVGPGMFLYCVALLGMVNVVLRVVLQAKVLDPELVLAGRWGPVATIRRLLRSDLAHGTSDLTAVSVFVSAAVVWAFGSIGAALTVTAVLSPVPVSLSWLAGAGAAVGVLVYSALLWRGIRAVARPRMVVYGPLVNRPASATAALAGFLHWVWTKTVNVAWALSGVFLLARLVATAWRGT